MFLQNIEYENGYFTTYDLISSTGLAIPGVETPQICANICDLTMENGGCSHFTWQEGGYCYLVDNESSLEYDSDKISGARKCHCERIFMKEKDISSDILPLGVVDFPRFYSLSFKLKPYQYTGYFLNGRTLGGHPNTSACYAHSH